MKHDTPTTIVILGGAGDLARIKLIPALFHLYVRGLLPTACTILGVARTERDDATYQQFVRDALKDMDHDPSLGSSIEEFANHFQYLSGSFLEETTYTAIATRIESFESRLGVCTNKLFYLAVPPLYYGDIFTLIHSADLALPCDGAQGWARILVEKPFGNDYHTARTLDQKLSSLFSEDQIFRIDHYLAKEAVQNILSFRFANTLMEAPWSNTYIKEVRIRLFETKDVSTRGAFYDSVGALKDVGQNHLLQLLALIAMDEPNEFSAQAIRQKRTEILERLVPIDGASLPTTVIRGQYEGYTDVTGVSQGSKTETFFSFTAHIDSPVWKGVPFHICGGKALDHDEVSVEIVFKDTATGPFETARCASVGNIIKLSISPEHAMHITLNAKQRGHGFDLESKTLSFVWNKEDDPKVEAYEKVLYDCIVGDQTLFTTTEEVLASWKFIHSITEHWNDLPLHIYQQGSTGPEIGIQ